MKWNDHYYFISEAGNYLNAEILKQKFDDKYQFYYNK